MQQQQQQQHQQQQRRRQQQQKEDSSIPEPPVNREPDEKLTISTKHSHERLVCKTPQESPNYSCGSLKGEEEEVDVKVLRNHNDVSIYGSLLYLGTIQVVFGLLMTVFGVMVIVHEAALAQLGGGLWGGCLAVASGTTGVLAAAQNWCPLKTGAQRVAHTIFLALSLVSVAVSQLVLVLGATGLARDLNRADFIKENLEDATTTTTTTQTTISSFSNLPPNYMALLSNAGLLIASGIQCICAAIASYRSSKALCPCFVKDFQQEDYRMNGKDAFVNSWLGKHGLQLPLYVVTAPPPPRRIAKRNNNLLPPGSVLTLPSPPPPPPPPPQIMGYPLIPAPLGPIPTPMIHVHPREMLHPKHNRYHSIDCPHVHEKPKKSKKVRKEQKQITTEELVRTYTGLDRTIAEEFIEICNSRNNSMYSDSSCCNGSHSDCTTCSGSCTT